jgi:hypothetical protein
MLMFVLPIVLFFVLLPLFAVALVVVAAAQPTPQRVVRHRWDD